MDNEEFDKIFSDLFGGDARKVEDEVVFDEGVKAITTLFKAFRANGLSILEAAGLTMEMIKNGND